MLIAGPDALFKSIVASAFLASPKRQELEILNHAIQVDWAKTSSSLGIKEEVGSELAI